jgi:aldehyde:ferredoxin oxidoreductase
MQVNGMLYDSLGICLFAHAAVRDHHTFLSEMASGLTGIPTRVKDLRQMAVDALEREREFNRRAGLGPESDRLPEIFCQEVNPSSKTVFDIDPEELDSLEYE